MRLEVLQSDQALNSQSKVGSHLGVLGFRALFQACFFFILGLGRFYQGFRAS